MKKAGKVDLTTGEIVEEIEERVAHRLNQGVMFRHPFHRHAVRYKSDKPDRCHQAHADSCDINTIIRQFDRTGLLPPATREGQYGDVSNLNRDLTELLCEVKETNDILTNERNERIARQKAESQKPPAPQPEATPPSTPAPASPPSAGT